MNQPAKHRILQVAPLSASPSADARLLQDYDVFTLWQHADRQAALAAHGKGITALVTSAVVGADAALIDALPDLKAICNWGVGFDTVDVAHAAKRGIQVSNTPDVLSDCVADMAWGLLIAGARQFSRGDQLVKSGAWPDKKGLAVPFGVSVNHKKLGIVGLGRIGLAIARRGLGFDMTVRYHNRRARSDVPYEYMASLVELAEWADFLVVATVGGAETRHLVNRDVLEALGPRGVIVNIARGTVIDEAALVEALQTGKLGAAALDVFEREPQVPEGLRTHENSFFMPHVGSASLETRMAMEDLMLENLAAFFATGKVVTPVN